ncbi:MAG TPA: hypothetical protein VGE39_06555 [Prosthecobacter sp.]
MWLFTIHGFYSLVRSPEGWQVRARVKQDLTKLRDVAGVTADVLESRCGSDYPWLMVVDEREKDALFRELSNTVEYDNFKSAIGRTPDQADKRHAYHQVWATMTLLEKEPDPAE